MQDKLTNLLRRAPELFLKERHTLINTTVGTLLACLSIVALTVPYQFAGGGMVGIALLSNYAWNLSPAWVLTFGNVVLLAWGWRELSFRFVFWTIYVTALTAVAVPLLSLYSYPLIENTILAALFGGMVGGVGYGMLFRVGASSGGTDVLVMVARKRWGVNIGSMSFYVNITILACSIVLIDIEQILMGGLLLYVETLVIDRVIRSFDSRVQLVILSKAQDQIQDYILKDQDRTATIMATRGAYSGMAQEMILVVLTRREAAELRNFIADVDPDAFIIFSDVSEVVGLGFKNWD